VIRVEARHRSVRPSVIGLPVTDVSSHVSLTATFASYRLQLTWHSINVKSGLRKCFDTRAACLQSLVRYIQQQVHSDATLAFGASYPSGIVHRQNVWGKVSAGKLIFHGEISQGILRWINVQSGYPWRDCLGELSGGLLTRKCPGRMYGANCPGQVPRSACRTTSLYEWRL